MRKMSIPQYPSNNGREDPPKSVVQGGTRTNKSMATNVRDLGNGLFAEIIMPAIKEMTYSTILSGLASLIFGASSAPNAPRMGGMAQRSPSGYHQPYQPGRTIQRQIRPAYQQPLSQQPVGFHDVYFDYESDALRVLAELKNRIHQYGRVSIGDYLVLSGVGGTNYTYERQGWVALDNVAVYATSDGYILDLPPVQLIR